MKVLQLIRVSVVAVTAAVALNLTATTFAISSTAQSKVKDFKLKPANGRVLRHSDISLAVRKTYLGVRPRITKRQSSMSDCYDVKFMYKNELKRVSFNCSNSGRYLTMMTK
ncbi:MAG: hypothetical protein ACPG47_00285 [Leucothrix sp.]